MQWHLGSPVVSFCPFYFGVSLLEPSIRKKGTLIKEFLGNLGIVAKKNPNLKDADYDDEEQEGEIGNGLVTKHAYGVLGCYEGHGFQLVRVRNPWGKKQEYTGDWCDASDKWKENPEVAKDSIFRGWRCACLHRWGVCSTLFNTRTRVELQRRATRE